MFNNVKIKLYLHLPPKFVTDPMKGIQDRLNHLLLKYHPRLDGVIMAYSNIELETNVARIINESPFIHFHITCELLLFKPVLGTKMNGIINLQSPGHIGLVVFNLFNVSIARTDIPHDLFRFVPCSAPTDDGLQHSIVTGNWVHVPSNTSLSIGSNLEFLISAITPSRHLIEMKGSLVGVPFTGITSSPPTSNSDPAVQDTGFKALTVYESSLDEDTLAAPNTFVPGFEFNLPAVSVNAPEKSMKSDRKKNRSNTNTSILETLSKPFMDTVKIEIQSIPAEPGVPNASSPKKRHKRRNSCDLPQASPLLCTGEGVKLEPETLDPIPSKKKKKSDGVPKRKSRKSKAMDG